MSELQVFQREYGKLGVMKDSLLLMLVATLVATASWAFWHYLGKEALDGYTAMIAVLLVLDNARLRRALKK